MRISYDGYLHGKQQQHVTDLIQVLHFRLHIYPGGGGGDGWEQGVGGGAQVATSIPATTPHNLQWRDILSLYRLFIFETIWIRVL